MKVMTSMLTSGTHSRRFETKRGPAWARWMLATLLVGLALGTGVLARATKLQLDKLDTYDTDAIASAYQPNGSDPYGFGPRANVGPNAAGGSPDAVHHTNESE